MSTTTPPIDSVRQIPPPSMAKPPLRENAFWRAKSTNAELAPLFPYLTRGCMVPAIVILTGGTNSSYGRFFHLNSVDETIVVYAANGALMETGQVASLGRLHAVTSFLQDEHDRASYMVAVVVQRQREEEEQSEALIFRCEKCNHVLYRWDFETTPGVTHGTERPDDRFPLFATQWGSMAAAEAFNLDIAARSCDECGHVNEAFPIDPWGWVSYCHQCEIANQGKRMLAAVDEQADSSNGS